MMWLDVIRARGHGQNRGNGQRSKKSGAQVKEDSGWERGVYEHRWVPSASKAAKVS